MCSLILLLRPDHAWPLLIAANRDERPSRPWRAPGSHWSDRPEVVAGHDLLSGGSWMGLNQQGLVACILNRVGSLGPAADKRSRGELVLEALDHANAAEAAEALSHLEADSYRSFNLIVADAQEAFWLRNEGAKGDSIETLPILPGLSMITAHNLNDPQSPRISRYLPLFRDALVPDPDAEDWSAWEGLLGDRAPDGDPYTSLCVVTDNDFGTVSSSLLAVPSPPAELGAVPRLPIWRFSHGRPDEAPFETLSVGGLW